MFQLLPEVRDVLSGFSEGVRRYVAEPSQNETWGQLAEILRGVDDRAEKLKGLILDKQADVVRGPLRDAMSLKKNNDRAFIAYVSAMLCGGNPDLFIDTIVALDILDFSVLLVDDILDCAEKRAGSHPHHQRWGKEGTLCVAMLLKSLASNMVVESLLEEDKKIRVLREMEELHSKTYEGQLIDVMYENMRIEGVRVADYLDMIRLTTGHQISGCFRIGGILAGATEGYISALGEIGSRFGMVGQIRDDVIDYILDESSTWKTPLLDFRRDKKRIPLIVAWKNATEHERREIRELQRKREIGKSDYLRISSIIMKPRNLVVIRRLAENLEADALTLAGASPMGSESLALVRMLFSIVRMDR